MQKLAGMIVDEKFNINTIVGGYDYGNENWWISIRNGYRQPC